MKIAVYGAGMVGRKVLTFLPRKGNEIVLWVDGKEDLWGTRLEGASGIYIIESPSELNNKDFDILPHTAWNIW